MVPDRDPESTVSPGKEETGCLRIQFLLKRRGWKLRVSVKGKFRMCAKITECARGARRSREKRYKSNLLLATQLGVHVPADGTQDHHGKEARVPQEAQEPEGVSRAGRVGEGLQLGSHCVNEGNGKALMKASQSQ